MDMTSQQTKPAEASQELSPDEIHDAWCKEAYKRLQQIESGEARTYSWEEVEERVFKQVSAR
jgi:hypothetical protein